MEKFFRRTFLESNSLYKNTTFNEALLKRTEKNILQERLQNSCELCNKRALTESVIWHSRLVEQAALSRQLLNRNLSSHDKGGDS